MKNIKVIFMGTTDFGVPALESLVAAGYEVQAAVCQPDRPNKRGKKVEILPLKAKALELGITVLQPEKIRDTQFVEVLKNFQSDIFVVAAYGQILSREILEIPNYGALNIHGSLLPDYRGAAPIQRAIIDGKKKTGVTIMLMSEGMDTGDMLSKAEYPITESTTFLDLYRSLSLLGGHLLIETMEKFLAGALKPVPQDNSVATYAEKILKDTGYINWHKSSREILYLINGTDPVPGAYIVYNDEKIKCFSPEIVIWEGHEKPGTIVIADDREGLVIKTQDGALRIGSIQAPGKKRLEATVFLRGRKMAIGTILN
ncbi:methionyl-tRNA formyltransferase [Acetobacterium wieringae]|jgi:methionyl-tRNA formyltransferase|uniref:Methionyl-tRNA formyltransferase n=1 Tax=Acetobacterium wieringae TaxID=52694 RepID=A0A1F2PH94_9FIRM|nr:MULTISPECIES: methionyl-tRNA formyltransferase [Acetobacterium]MEA4804734.1 methionyl-tRNA formyltransferase [Acetobacterium wieringae]OFV70698.1 methionyl-tRNA formyltransferase [Acetobacterium wieringae]UYO61394.1 methionyl-tRNA formyltransferase [Acetobacterium wieringae]VUZ28707.1 Methionyl-tRNA formyltransferase [Acetobacterium wieringae]